MKIKLLALCLLLAISTFAGSSVKGTINMISILNSPQTIDGQSQPTGTILILLKNTFTMNSSQQWVSNSNIWLQIGNVTDPVGRANLAQAFSQLSGFCWIKIG